MGVEENKEVMKQLIERMGEGDSSAIEELTTEDFVLRVMRNEYMEVDKETLIQTNDMGHKGIPDYSMTIDDMIAEGDKVFVLSTRRGTHSGVFVGVPPTGNKLKIYRFALYRLENGKVAEMWAMDDTLGQFQQLGVMPKIAEAIKAYNDSLK